MVNFKMSKAVYIYTYGCQMNEHDSEKMLGVLSENGYTVSENPEAADLIIFNTCAIREKAEQKFYSQLGRTKLLKRNNKNLKIAVAGCVAQDAKDRIIRKTPYVDFVIGPQNINSLHSVISADKKLVIDENPGLGAEEFVTKRENSLKAWVSIMYGCNNFCSYCIVPHTRGRETSRRSGHIIQEVRRLYEEGYKEITLLGQNVNSYRSDIGFVDLLRKVSAIPIKRIRFVTSHPRDFSSELMDAVSELPNVCEHIHLPLQSGSDRILQMMNRGYTSSEYLDKIGMLRSKIPGIAVTADIIAGFPGETDEDFHETVDALHHAEFDGIFAFKYSARRGTRAYEMAGQVPEHEKGARLNSILKIQEAITFRKNETLEGSLQEILVEGPSDTDSSLLSGRTRTNKIVTYNGPTSDIGKLTTVEITKARLHSLLGVSVKNS